MDVSIRRDVAKFDRNAEMPGTLETIQVRAPWRDDQLLTFPLTDDALMQHNLVKYSGHFDHPHNITFHLFRGEHPPGIHQSAPRREGVLIQCDSVKLMIVSASALEYYWDDNDDQRARQFSHLDFELWDMKDVSSFGGLLPEVWGLKPKANQDDHGQSQAENRPHPQILESEVLANMQAPEQSSPQNLNKDERRRELTREILTNMLYPKSTDDNTAAVVCSGLQCSRPSESLDV